jgi:hypothetical protein
MTFEKTAGQVDILKLGLLQLDLRPVRLAFPCENWNGIILATQRNLAGGIAVAAGFAKVALSAQFELADASGIPALVVYLDSLLQERQTSELLREDLGANMLQVPRQDDATLVLKVLFGVVRRSVERLHPIKGFYSFNVRFHFSVSPL